jgi:hypothetical protein
MEGVNPFNGGEGKEKEEETLRHSRKISEDKRLGREDGHWINAH